VPRPSAEAPAHEPDLPLSPRTLAVTLGLSWVPLALGETLLGDLDALDDVHAIAAGSAAIATAGLLHCLSGILLAFAGAGLLARMRKGVAGRVVAGLVLVVAVCLGAFGMLHLLALETAGPDLEPSAMNAFLQRLSEAPGWWSVPVGFVALLGLPVLAATCLWLGRAGAVRWWGPGAVTAAAVAHFALGSGTAEIVSLWVAAAGLLLVGVDLARPVRTRRRTPDTDSVPAGH
jgi:hypothetical protein